MAFNIFIFSLVLVSYFTFANSSMRCTRISSTDVFDEYDYGNITGSAVLTVYKRNNIQYISVSDVSVMNYATNETANQFCVAGSCTTDFSTPFEVQIGNGTFAMDAYFPTGNGFEFFEGGVDDEGFFEADGTLYSLDNLCTTALYNQSNLIDKETHCCMAFKPVPVVPSNAPRCTKFQSRSSLLNVDDNYSIFATSNMIFNMDDNNNVTAFGNFSGPDDFTIDYFFNENWLCDSDVESSTVNCYWYAFPPNVDSKVIVSLDFVQWNGNSGTGWGGMMARILLRNNQVLMEEGVPFSKANNCMYRNFPYGGNSNQVINNQFCCTEFENDPQDKVQHFPILSHPPKLPEGFVKHSNHDRYITKRLPSKKAQS